VFVKKDKKEGRLLVLTPFRGLLFKVSGKAGSPATVDKEFHWLDIVTVKSEDSSNLHIVLAKETLSMTSQKVDKVISLIRKSFDRCFVGAPESAKLKLAVTPASRLKDLGKPEKSMCAGFATTYSAFADYFGVKKQEDIFWDIQHIYGPKNIRTLNLADFDVLEAGDIRALLAALRYNTHFRGLIASSVQIDSAALHTFGDSLRTNVTLEYIDLSGCGAGDKEGIALAEGLAANSAGSSLIHLDLRNTHLEDKAVTALATAVGSAARGLVKLDVSHNRTKKSGMGSLAQALAKNRTMLSSLTHLNMSHTAVGAEGSAALAAFLKEPNALKTLALSHSAVAADIVVNALLRGSKASLLRLDLSGNKFKDARVLANLLQGAGALRELNVAGTACDGAGLRDALVAASKNPYLQALSVNASDNGLGPAAAQLLGKVASALTVVELDLSDNEFGDVGVASLASGFAANSSVRALRLDRVFKVKGGSPPGARTKALNALKDLINSPSSPLTTLSLKGGKGSQLGKSLVDFIYDVGQNTSLTCIHVDGHESGDRGAVALGKALLSNSTLQEVSWDENGTTAAGFAAFRSNMRQNYSLRTMPTPVHDFVSIAKAGTPDDVAAAKATLADIERLVARNHSPTAKFASEGKDDQSGGKQDAGADGNNASLAAQDLDRLVGKVRSLGDAAGMSDAHQLAVQDAESMEQFVSNLYTARAAAEAVCQQAVAKALNDVIASQLSTIVAKAKADIVASVVAQSASSLSSLDEETRRRMQSAVTFGAEDVSDDELRAIFVDRGGSELGGKVAACLSSSLDIAIDFAHEKMTLALEDVAEEIKMKRRGTMVAGDGSAAAAAAPGAAGDESDSDSEPPPPPPPPESDDDSDDDLPVQTVKTTTSKFKALKGLKKATEGKPTATTDVAKIEKKEGNLTHLTKNRAKPAGNRRPPQRRPRRDA
jgi:Ran GTPase-activating protein (RanGAP) involved in mRNA processing and transport